MFLTLEDPNARIKGSRDPLGAQPVWASFGRQVVTNLTMQTTSVRGFTVLLVGRWLVARLVKGGRLGAEAALDAFLRFEQIGAYARHVAHGVGGEIRGIERVRANVAEHNGRVPISTHPDDLILGDQKVNGLWGLYSVSARESGLIGYGPVEVSPAAEVFIERHYRPLLAPALSGLLQLVARGGVLDTRRANPVFDAVSGILAEDFTAAEIEFYGAHLRDGLHVPNAPRERQRRFRELLEAHANLEQRVSRAEVVGLARAAAAGAGDPGLAGALDRIVAVESVLAPAMAAFDFVLHLHGRSIADAARALRAHWGESVPNVDPGAGEPLLAEVRAASSEAVEGCFRRVMGGLAAGDFAAVIEALLEWNAATMHERGGAPWVRVGSDGRLDVRFRGIEQAVPDRDALPQLWRNGYFIDSLKAITRQLQRRR